MNGVGSAALLAVGAAFTFLATSGSTLKRIKFGENEVEFEERVGRKTFNLAKDPKADKIAAEVAVEIIEEAAVESGQPVPPQLRSWISAAEFEREVLDALSVAAPRMKTRLRGDLGVDAIVDDSIGLLIKYIRDTDPAAWSRLRREVERIIYVPTEGAINRLLVISNASPPARYREWFEGQGKAQLVEWRPDMGSEPLVAALRGK